jgi:hypothetical protein
VADEADPTEALRHDYRSAFGGISGPRVLADIEAFTGDQHDLYSDNPLDMAYRLGMRRVLLRIRSMMKGVPS